MLTVLYPWLEKMFSTFPPHLEVRPLNDGPSEELVGLMVAVAEIGVRGADLQEPMGRLEWGGWSWTYAGGWEVADDGA